MEDPAEGSDPKDGFCGTWMCHGLALGMCNLWLVTPEQPHPVLEDVPWSYSMYVQPPSGNTRTAASSVTTGIARPNPI